MRAKRKSRIAFIIAGILGVAIIVAAILVWLMIDKATNFDGDPNNKNARLVTTDQIDWDYWKSINPDVIGWVFVDNTNINYPIVQAHSDDPDYYLSHDIYKDYNIYGVPYLDADCAAEGFESKNAIIYGHNMDDGTIFRDFANYSNITYAQEHSSIRVFTPDKTYTIETRYVDVVPGDALAKRVLFETQGEFNTWYIDNREAAVVVLDATTRPSKIMTFVTCSYNFSNNERTMVVGSD